MRVKPGAFYYGVKCRSCGSPIALVEEKPSQNVTFEGPVAMDVTCEKCGTSGSYRPQLVERFQALPEA